MATQILPETEVSEFEDRTYLNPSLGVTATNEFIDNLRSSQQADNQQIIQQTQALGADTPSNLGGLTGGEGYWTSRYQTPQTNAAVADLRASAQATALNEALANEKAMWDKRYQEAYRNYQKRAWNKQNTPTTNANKKTLEVDTNSGGGSSNNSTSSQEVSLYSNDGDYQSGKLYPVTDYVSDYKDASGQWWQVISPTGRDVALGPNAYTVLNPQNEQVTTSNGQNYMYLDNIPNRNAAWYRVVRSAGPNTYSPYAGS